MTINHQVYTKENETIKKLRKEIFGETKLPTLINEATVRYYLVLFLDETPLGYIEMGKIDPETYEVTSIGVVEKYRLQKVGTYLIKYGQVKLKTVGGRKMRALVEPTLLPFFSKNNFRCIDDELNEIDNKFYVLTERKMY